MSETNETPEELPESPESEQIEQPEIIGSEPVEVVDVYDMETVELPAEYAPEYPRNIDKFGPEPMDMICPECGVTMTTITSTETTRFDSTSCFYACLNACFGGIEITKHRCPACDAILGTYNPSAEQTNNYRSGSPNGFITNNGAGHVITQEDVGARVEFEPAANDCLEVEDCGDDEADDDKLNGGDEDVACEDDDD